MHPTPSRLQVLVLVKASPQPSLKYGDTVCVAGSVVGDNPRWIRLYPVPFRYMTGEQQFKKYDLIEVQVRDAGADKRSESHKINAESIKVVGHIGGWQNVAPFVESLPRPTMCELQRGTTRDLNGPSLGAVVPAEVGEKLLFEDHGPWTEKQIQNLRQIAIQPDLFGLPLPPTLTPPRFRVKLPYRCHDSACGGHEQRILDWELNALQLRYTGDDAALKKAVTANFLTRMFKSSTEPVIFVGNQENVQRRSAFTVLGVYYPQAGTIQSPLF